MTTTEARAYANQRYAELKEDNPSFSRDQIATLIIGELRKDHNFVMMLGNCPIVGVTEDDDGLTYQVQNLIRGF